MKVFMSAERSNLSKEENQNRTTFLLGWLHAKGMPFKRVVGCYEGKEEASFMVQCEEGTNDVGQLVHMAKKLEQDSVLLLDKKNKASLIFCNDLSEEPIGEMIEVSETVAKMQSGYTWDKEENKFYTTRSI